MEVIVPDDQLSLAIGKKGQNVRLASRLTGWKPRRAQRVRGRGRGAARARVADGDPGRRRRDGRAALPGRLQVGARARGVRRGRRRRDRRHRPGACDGICARRASTRCSSMRAAAAAAAAAARRGRRGAAAAAAAALPAASAPRPPPAAAPRRPGDAECRIAASAAASGRRRPTLVRMIVARRRAASRSARGGARARRLSARATGVLERVRRASRPGPLAARTPCRGGARSARWRSLADAARELGYDVEAHPRAGQGMGRAAEGPCWRRPSRLGMQRQALAELAHRRRDAAPARRPWARCRGRRSPLGTERVVAERVVTQRELGAEQLVTAREQTDGDAAPGERHPAPHRARGR